ncbi:MAG: FKBP-type peptidyl-prolyl cis-trans isomerase [Gammaproteobacteria bacterium]|jgi:FKBP-type peptidyl-prolyl cis-trans isomerase 2|nr:FKBP-type peptidyl-prolyl cis-trans isomerase [Gammaproteobacteria bacterium]
MRPFELISSTTITRLLSALMVTGLVPVSAIAEESKPMITAGNQVSFEYTLSVSGEVVESNKGQAPLTYTQGGGQILPALESELEGLTVGDEKSVSLAAADGYGEVNPEAFQEVPADRIPEDARVVGAMLQSPEYPGPIRVAEVREEVVVLDLNHPMAGKDLQFDITIVDVVAGPAAAE